MKKCIYFIFAILAMVSISSCSNDDEGGNGTNSITVMEKSEYAVTANDLKNKSDIPILLFLACTGYQ